MRASLAAIVLLTSLALGCAAPQPTSPPNAIVHFRNLSGTALVVSVGAFGLAPPSGASPSGMSAIRPCGGQVSLVAPVPPADDPRLSLYAVLDTSGALDALVAEAAPSADLSAPEFLEQVSVTPAIIWSRGQYGINDLPLWVTFHSGTTDVSATQPVGSPPPSCAPWPPSD